jgi:hypothetical protein
MLLVPGIGGFLAKQIGSSAAVDPESPVASVRFQQAGFKTKKRRDPAIPVGSSWAGTPCSAPEGAYG